MSDIGTAIDFCLPVVSTGSVNSLGAEIGSLTIASNTAAAAWPSANLAIFVPVRIGYPFTAVKMFWLNGATVGTNSVDVGIYDSQGNQLVHSGSTATSGATGIQTVSITSTTLEMGLYYMAMAVNGTTDTSLRGGTGGIATPWALMGAYQMATAFALPSTATFAQMAQTTMPIIGMSSSSTL